MSGNLDGKQLAALQRSILNNPASGETPEAQPTADPQPTTDAQPMPGLKPLWPDIRSIIETELTQSPRSRQKEIGPSELGGTCLHCLAARLRGWPKREPRDHGWTPALGTFMHEHMERLFTRENEKLADLRFITEYRVNVGVIHGIAGSTPVHGSIDLWDKATRATIDWKLVGDWSLKRKRAHGMPQQYVIQASLYGIGLTNEGEPVERSCIYAMPKNGRNGLADTLAYEMPFDPQPGRWALARAQLLVNLLDSIEQADGPAAADAWTSQLPTNPDDCFQCHDNAYAQPDMEHGLWAANHPKLIDRYRPLIGLLQPQYPNNQTDNQ